MKSIIAGDEKNRAIVLHEQKKPYICIEKPTFFDNFEHRGGVSEEMCFFNE